MLNKNVTLKKSDSQSSRPGALCPSLAPLPANIWTQTRFVNVLSAEELRDNEPAGGTNPAPLASIAALISAICSAAFFPPPREGSDGAEERPLRQGSPLPSLCGPEIKAQPGQGLLPGVTPPGGLGTAERAGRGPCLPTAGGAGRAGGGVGGTAGGRAEPSLALRPPAGRPAGQLRPQPPPPQEAQEAAEPLGKHGPCPAQLSTAWGPPPEGPRGREGLKGHGRLRNIL